MTMKKPMGKTFVRYKPLFVMVMSVLVTIASHGVSASGIRDHRATKISRNTYVIHGPLGFPDPKNRGFMNNPAFVITKTGVIVIDPGSSRDVGRMLLRQIRRFTKKPVTHVFNTHIHGDHWLGNDAIARAYPRATIMAHRKMITAAKSGAAAQWIGLMNRLTKGATRETKAVLPGRAVVNGYELKTGGMTVRIYAPAKAHSGTDIMIYFVEESVVFLGDNVLNRRIARMEDATFRGSIKACDIAIAIGARHYVPGHGKTSDAAMVRRFRDYLATIFREVRLNYDKGLSDYEMKPKIVAKLKAYHSWNGFKDEVGRHINLAMLEIEKSLFK